MTATVVHDGEALATTVETADTRVRRARGLMFRRGVPDDYALVFPFDGVATRPVHMLFVLQSLDVLWVADGAVERVATLRPWVGSARARADLVVELPAGAADDVAEGDTVRVTGVV